MQFFLDESKCKNDLVPFSLTRHVADIRIGILTIREKWRLLTADSPYTLISEPVPGAWAISANMIPSIGNYEFILQNATEEPAKMNSIRFLKFPWQIFQLNDEAIREDFLLLTRKRVSASISSTNKIIAAENIFIEPGAQVEHSILNASAGPIYIGKNSLIMEGNMIRGPFSVCEGAVLKMGSKVYGATTIGPYCTAGGEIKNSVMFGYSNKAHDGYLGDSVIGEWCNLGAGTSNSNVKNTGGEVKFSAGSQPDPVSAGQKGGLLMGDYSRAAINTSFNTGTVVGVCCNIFGPGMPGKKIANFSWGNERYEFEKAIRDIGNWKKMKGQQVSGPEKELLKQLYLSNQ